MGYAGKWEVVIDTKASQADGRKPLMPYQQEAIDRLKAFFDLTGKAEGAQSGMLVMPTGSGKTFTTVTWLLSQGVAQGYRVIWLVHRQELVEQTFREFCKLAPTLADYGVPRVKLLPVSGKHATMSMAVGNDITVASILSVASKNGMRHIRRMLGNPGKEKLVVVIDEAHHAAMPSYQKVLKRMQRINPHLVLLGLTATPRRMQNNNRLLRMFHLAKGEAGYRGPVYQISLEELIKDGFLSVPKYQRIATGIHGDTEYELTKTDVAFYEQFQKLPESVFDAIASNAARNQLIVKEYLDHRAEYGKTLVFAINKKHAEQLAKEFSLAGVPAEYVVSGEKKNRETIERFRQGEFPVLVNIQIMTEGVDVPDVHTVFLTRETNSDVLFMQMVGRGLRGVQAGGTKDCHIVDFHDQWEKLQFWFHSEKLSLFTLEEEGEDGGDTVEAEAKTRRLPRLLPKTMEASYLDISQVIRGTLRIEKRSTIWPVGWYNLSRVEDVFSYIVVLSDREEAFADCMELLEDKLKEEHMELPAIQKICKKMLTGAAGKNDIDHLAAYVSEHQATPPYFDLAEEDAASPQSIVEHLFEQYENVTDKLTDEQVYWLHAQYESSERMKAIYGTFVAFRRSVENLLARQQHAHLMDIEDRREYHVEPDAYDLEELLGNVYDRFPQLSKAKILDVRWSRHVVKSWFGRCTALAGDRFLIEINRLLSSHEVPQEAIEYLLYHELLHANGKWAHTPEFRDAEWRFPDSARWDSFLDRMNETFKLDYKALRKEAEERKDGRFHFMKKAKGETYASTVIAEEETAWKEKQKSGGDAAQTGIKKPAPTKFSFATGFLTRGYNPHFQPDAPGVKAGTKYCCYCGKPMPSVSTICPHCDREVPVRRNAK
jgi:superfamily II DNA or RNA helicase